MKIVFLKLIGFQLFSVVFAISIFQIIDSRTLAGFFAGMTFLAASASSLRLLWFENLKFGSPTFILGWIQLLVIVLPMIAIRVANWDLPFDEILYYGKLKGPEFHKFSERVYGSWIIVTGIEGLIRSILLSKKS